jgi:hypothetical protein
VLAELRERTSTKSVALGEDLEPVVFLQREKQRKKQSLILKMGKKDETETYALT